MERPAEDISGVLRKLLSTDTAQVVKTVDEVYAPEAQWECPIFIWKGRSQVKQVWRTFSHANWAITNVQTVDSSFDSETGRLYAEVDFRFKPLVYLLKQTARLVLVFDLTRVQTGGRDAWIITSQEDFYEPDALFGAVVPEPFGRIVSMMVLLLQIAAGSFATLVLYYVNGFIAFVLRHTIFEHKTPAPSFKGPLHNATRDGAPLIASILDTHTAQVEQLVNNSFSENAEFYHPLGAFIGKENIRRVYTTWSRTNWLFRNHDIGKIAFNPQSHTLYLDVNYEFWPLWYLGTGGARIIAVLSLEKVDGHAQNDVKQQADGNGDTKGTWLIKRQVDYFQSNTHLRAFLPGFVGISAQGIARILQVIGGTLFVHLVAPFVIIACLLAKTVLGK